MTTPLPSFVELMASLGLEPTAENVQLSSVNSSPSDSPLIGAGVMPSPIRSRSNPSLREFSAPHARVARYSPYSSTLSFTHRRGSLSSVSSSSSDPEWSPLQPSFPSSPVSAKHAPRPRNQLSINVYDSSSDLPANTPISSYLRRKTPAISPTSPTFPRDQKEDLISMPLTIPILPSLLSSPVNSDYFPSSPRSDGGISSSTGSSPASSHTALPDYLESVSSTRKFRRRTGVRISTPPCSAGLSESYCRRRPAADILAK